MSKEEKNKGGRPRVVFDEKQIKEVERFAAVLNVDQIAELFGISEATFYRILDRQPEVMRAYKRGRAVAAGRVAQTLFRRACDGDLTAAIFYLKTRAGWRETKHLAHSSEDGVFGVRDVEQLTDAELLALISSDRDDDAE